MKAVYVQKGSSFDYTPAVDVAAGSVVVQDDLIGIAKLDIPAGTLGQLHREGIFDIVTADDFTVGDKVYWDAATKAATATAIGNKLLGLAAAATAEGDERVMVVINVPCDVLITSAAAIANLAATANDFDDQSGGTASEAHQLAAVGDTSTDQSGTINNNFATIGAEYNALKDDVEAGNAKINAILAALRTLGLVAAE